MLQVCHLTGKPLSPVGMIWHSEKTKCLKQAKSVINAWTITVMSQYSRLICIVQPLILHSAVQALTEET